MDQIARNAFGALYFDKVAPVPPPTSRIFHNLTRLAKQSNALPELVPQHPPEPSTSYSRGQKKPINIFKRLVPKLERSLKAGRPDIEWTMITPSMTPSDVPTFARAGLDIGADPIPTLEQLRSAEGVATNSIYYPQSALVDALGLPFNRVISGEPLSYSQPRAVKFASSTIQPTQSQTRVPRITSRYSLPRVLPQSSRATSGKDPRYAPGHPLRKSSSSSRRTSRSLMVGHNPIGVSASTTDIDQPLTSVQRRSSRHIQALKRKTQMSPLPQSKPAFPPVEIHPLTFSPFLSESSDHHASSIGGSSTPSISTPPSGIAPILSITPQKEARDQKNRRRYGRCPSTFLNLGPSGPLAFSIERQRKDIAFAAPQFNPPPPRSDSLRGCSRASLERAEKAKEIGEKTKASLRPKLTIQIPKTETSSQISAIHRRVESICTGDIKVDIGRASTLPLISITRH